MRNNWSYRLLAMMLALMLALPGLGLAEGDVIVAEQVEDAVSDSAELLLGEDAEPSTDPAADAPAAQDAELPAIADVVAPSDEDAAEPPAEGAVEQAVEGAGEQTVEGSGEQTVEGAAEQTVEGAAEQTVEGAAEQTFEGAGEQTVEGAGEQTFEGAGEQTFEGAGEQTFEGAGEQTVEGSGEQSAAAAATAATAPSELSEPAKLTAEAQAITSDPITGNTSFTLNVGDTLQLVMAEPVKSFKSSKKKVASVSATGLISANKEGRTTVTAVISKKKKIKITVTVNDLYKPSAVAIDMSQGSDFFIGLGPVQLNTLMEPASAQASLKWKSSKKRVATVSNTGVLIPLRAGRTKITVTTGNRKKYSTDIRVHRNIIDNISPRPTRAQVKSIGSAWAIQMKSLERTATGKYIATFYLLDGLGRARWINNFNVQIYLGGKLLCRKNIGKLKVYCEKGDWNKFKVTFNGNEVSWKDLLVLPTYTPESVNYVLTAEPSLYYNHKMLIGFMQDRQNVFTELPAGVQNEAAMASYMLELINQVRAAMKLKPLTMDEELTRAACVRAGELAVKFRGTRPDGSSVATVSMKNPAETRALMRVSTDDLGGTKAVFDSLLTSKGDASRMSNKGYKTVGICAYKVVNPKNQTTSVYWAIEYGTW